MRIGSIYRSIVAGTARWMRPLQAPFALVARLYVSWQFLKSGYLKVTSWDTTEYLFANEYHVPVLNPHVAAVAGSFGELFFPTLLVLGLVGRMSAAGVFFVNGMAVVSYSQFLLADGHEAALAQHVLWGSISLFLIIYGVGSWSLDAALFHTARDSRAT
jgi:putative oxidoreductase